MQERLHSKIMEAKDSRIKATSETLKSMRVLKLHSWESTFLKKLLKLRETERSKSSLLFSVLGEIPKISDASIMVYGSKSYVPQSAWIQTGTVRENVLFGREMNKALYEDVVEGCSLIRDIEMWADGDSMVVGERGMNLSGGQKQRIQLARAIYNDSDVYLLDDPFSAVDAHTGAHMFKASTILSLFSYFVSSSNDKCLMQLLCGKTVVYATHQLEFLDASDLVLSGKYQELIADPEGELLKQMTAHSKSLNQVILPKIATIKRRYMIRITKLKSQRKSLKTPPLMAGFSK
ncbi:hypothetical protein LguiB_026212 [Lonicera macranthoides]